MSLREPGYYWVRPFDPDLRGELYDGWEPAEWDGERWLLVGRCETFEDNTLEAGKRIKTEAK